MFLHSKTIIQTPISASSKTTFRRGGGKCFLPIARIKKNVSQKIAQKGDNLDFYSEMVRMKGLEPSRREALVPKTSVSTNSTTSAYLIL